MSGTICYLCLGSLISKLQFAVCHWVPLRVPKKTGSAIDIGIAATVNNNFVPALVRAAELRRLRAFSTAGSGCDA